MKVFKQPMDTAFPYRVRESLRSRSVQLRVSVEQGLEVVLPRGFNAAGIPGLLKRRHDWIRTALDRVARYRERVPLRPPWQLPEQIVLPLIGGDWRVEPLRQDTAWATVRRHRWGVLRLCGNLDSEPACRAALHRWLCRTARTHLVPMLGSVSRETGLGFSSVRVRHQRSRWASCSRGGSIHLNARLLFLKDAQARYVMIHELCHTKEMNHSSRYWRLVASHCPDCREIRRELRQVWRTLPDWVHDGAPT